MDLPGPVAYFSMEFGIHESLGVYSGGLGVLAGDHCKAASDLGVPLVGVGLLYRSGYFRQTVDADGFQQHIYPDYDFARLPILPVQSPGGGVLTVPVDLPGRIVQAAVWKAQVGRVPVLMLDTDIPLNDPADRPITGVLYVRGREMRLCQEIVLGVGGVRALVALGIHPSVWHMNEGHVAFLNLERARERVREGDGLSDALKAVARNTVFTTHTPVPAGNETFDRKLVRRYLEFWVREVGCDPDEALALGADNGNFNMTALAIRLSSRTNGVSQLHAQVSSAHVAPPLRGRARGAGGRDHQRRPHRELGGAGDARLLRPAPGPALGAAPAGGRVLDAHPRRARRRALGGAPLAEGAAHPLRPRAGAAAVGAPRPLSRRAAHGGGAPRPPRPHHRLRPPLRDLQAGVPHPLRPRPPARARGRPRAAGAAHLRGQGPPRGPRGAGGDPPPGRPHQGGVPGASSCSWRTTTSRSGGRWCRAATSGSTPRAGPRKRAAPAARRCPINGGVNVSILDGWWAEGFRGDNGWAIGDGKVDAGHRRAGPERRGVALPDPLRGSGAPLLRPRRVGPAPPTGSRP